MLKLVGCLEYKGEFHPFEWPSIDMKWTSTSGQLTWHGLADDWRPGHGHDVDIKARAVLWREHQVTVWVLVVKHGAVALQDLCSEVLIIARQVRCKTNTNSDRHHEQTFNISQHYRCVFTAVCSTDINIRGVCSKRSVAQISTLEVCVHCGL